MGGKMGRPELEAWVVLFLYHFQFDCSWMESILLANTGSSEKLEILSWLGKTRLDYVCWMGQQANMSLLHICRCAWTINEPHLPELSWWRKHLWNIYYHSCENHKIPNAVHGAVLITICWSHAQTSLIVANGPLENPAERRQESTCPGVMPPTSVTKLAASAQWLTVTKWAMEWRRWEGEVITGNFPMVEVKAAASRKSSGGTWRERRRARTWLKI